LTLTRGFSALAVLSIGVFGMIGCGTDSFAFTNAMKAAVLAAAPVKTILVVPENEARLNLTAPPPYTMVELINFQSLTSRPSICCVPRLMMLPFIFSEDNPGTFGVKSPALNDEDTFGGGGATGDCARVTIWLPKNSDPSVSPTMNDPNAKVILDISPPPSGRAGNCSVWEYRYGEPPPLRAPRRKAPAIIPLKTVPQSTKYGQ
jgi:hypothetical protein